MGPLELRILTPADEAAYLKARSRWGLDTGVPFTSDFDASAPFQNYLQLLEDRRLGANLPPGRVPDTHYFGFVDGEIVGRLSIRHELNEFLERLGGHIGYGVVPEFRRRGYARRMLELSLPLARGLGFTKVLLTCADDNIGSIRTIESCGGDLQDKVDAGAGQPLRRRYWIQL